jgi:hypothetical protein
MILRPAGRAVIFNRLGGKIKGKMRRLGESRLFLPVILILRPIFPYPTDHEQDQDHEQEGERTVVIARLPRYNPRKLRP